MLRIIKTTVLLSAVATLWACSPQDNSQAQKSSSPAVSAAEKQFEQRLSTLELDADNWVLHGRTYKDQRFSPLDQISTDNVSQLGLSWYMDLPRDGGQEATPIVVDGVMYFSSTWGQVYAVDAETGAQKWHYDPKVPKEIQVKACCGPVNRGVAYWNGKVFVGALDGRLIALDAATGQQLWSTQTVDTESPYTITGAPRVVAGKVIIGNGGAEFAVRGYVTAYDVNTGEKAWRFYTVPGDPAKPFENKILEKAAETWHGEWWKLGGGGTVWDSISYDPQLNLVYIGVGNGSPWNPIYRSNGKGDNLFISSIVALNADTGEYVWHYQTTPGDGWDYTATQNMVMDELEIDGKLRKVIMQAPKNGFFYVLDRETGELLSAEPYVKVNWASHIDKATGRPVYNPEARYWETGKQAMVFPSSYGGHNWKPMAYSPETKLIYLPASDSGLAHSTDKDFKWVEVGRNTGVTFVAPDFPQDAKTVKAIRQQLKGLLVAWNPVKQHAVWTVEQEFFGNGGVLATAGNLVFQGTAGGKFAAYSADKGEQLWQFDANTAVIAAPVTYRVDGEQYVAVLVGRGGITGRMFGRFTAPHINRSRLLVFKLGAQQQLPEPNEPKLALPDLSGHKVDPAAAKAGGDLYAKYCVFCHGLGAVAGGMVPDLRYSGFIQSPEGFEQVVMQGILKDRGMAGFAASINAEESESIRHYLVRENQLSREYGDTSRVGR